MRSRSHGPERLLLGSLALACALAIAFPAAAGAAPIKLGVYSASQGQVGAPEDARALDEYAAEVGRKPDIVMDYSNLGDPLLTPTEISNLAARDETPMVTWQLYRSGWGGPTIPLQDIASGAYDSDLRAAAQLAKETPFQEILIRFGHEMNGDWYGWSGSPTAYVEAWRHVVTVFRQVGATNVKWVWSPNVDNGSYPFASYFPGDAWVDYVGLDGYNWGTAGVGADKWQSLEQVFSSSYEQLTRLSSKPVMITEVSSSEAGGDKASWITEGFLHTIPEKFPRVQAVIWYDRSQEEDWRIASSKASLDAYRQVVSSSLYGGTDPPPASGLAEPAPIVVRALQVTPTQAAPGAGGKGRTVVGKRARVVYRLSRRASVRVVVHARTRGGRRIHGSLAVLRGKRSGSVGLSQLFGGRRLRRGAYRVVVTATDPAGAVRSAPRTTGFLVETGRRG